jgi:polar amino acid transport system permease protein
LNSGARAVNFSFDVILHNLPYLLGAAKWTVLISLAGMAISIGLGVIICAARMSKTGVLRRLAAVYMLPYIGLDMPAIMAAIFSVGLCSAAYTAEILRGALQTIPAGQTEAAHALGMPPLSLWRRILVPQALRLGMPSLINELILLVKVSSLASVVGIGELTRVAQNITGQTYRPLEIYLAAAAVYFVINFAIAQLGRMAERRLQLR